MRARLTTLTPFTLAASPIRLGVMGPRATQGCAWGVARRGLLLQRIGARLRLGLWLRIRLDRAPT
jgi:hypothetical protein